MNERINGTYKTNGEIGSNEDRAQLKIHTSFNPSSPYIFGRDRLCRSLRLCDFDCCC